ncbi:hypothetical protein ACFWFQ_15075 [Nocardia salmonicida]
MGSDRDIHRLSTLPAATDKPRTAAVGVTSRQQLGKLRVNSTR